MTLSRCQCADPHPVRQMPYYFRWFCLNCYGLTAPRAPIAQKIRKAKPRGRTMIHLDELQPYLIVHEAAEPHHRLGLLRNIFRASALYAGAHVQCWRQQPVTTRIDAVPNIAPMRSEVVDFCVVQYSNHAFVSYGRIMSWYALTTESPLEHLRELAGFR